MDVMRREWKGAGRWRVVAAIAALSIAAACSEVTSSPPAVTADADAWSGGTLVLRSDGFAGADTLPVVTVGGRSLAVRSFGAESVAVQLPDTNGAITMGLQLTTGAAPSPLAVRVHGFRALAPGPRVDGDPYPWPAGGVPTALAFQDGRLVRLDYRDNTALPLTADTNLYSSCLSGPAPSATEAGLVTVAPADSAGTGVTFCHNVIAVPTSAGAADTAWSTGDYRPSVHLARERWLITGHSGVGARLEWKLAGGAVASTQICTEAYRVSISPRGDRVALTCTDSLSPVVDPAGPAVAFVLPVRRASNAAFTPAGDTLFAVGSDASGHAVLASADATTGTLLRLTPLAWLGGPGTALVADPGRPWLYVWSNDTIPPYLPLLEVRNRSTLAHVATLRVPAAAAQAGPAAAFWGDSWTMLVNSADRKLLVTAAIGSGATITTPSPATWVLSFDLMP